ncbi:mannose/cellobiose epimerase-like protein (N-acyl-D-glucosamine 2-epimerase family) [Halorubrum alkaliphilum]|uniref:Mannose/cellobiose epimerase-like protein (N-acyl-D-glucosamine 2-epimerase family) n=1 Tax=Halorubrum alkaliphilum TaxID=261290 RepID=A0A8T4G9M3_9EURY|nr:AGE family epimerase/isomerase [Halorubrum alkaliphilum]MBP1921114.1 mannose/cellobiose epimerase-like protein (N-acyl-D-glucosamine 2-epimerase family) [Halorubrum alkaliphilum]
MTSNHDTRTAETDALRDRAGANRGGVLATLRVQYPDVLADRGFRLLHPRTGDHYTGDRRHLVATCRSIANLAVGALVDGPDWCIDAAEHGLRFLREAHRATGGEHDDGAGGGYHLVVDGSGEPVDRTRSAYAHAFVLLAYARSTDAGIEGAAADLEATHELIEARFRDEAGLLRSDCDPDWTEKEAYRGQNANMHACEAYLAAYEATGEERYLDRARHIAETITVELAGETGGLLWEHYSDEWDHDFAYNEETPRHQFRPPGYQPGHHIEWAKFLALLDRYGADPPKVDAGTTGWYERARELFDSAVDHGWAENGFVYTHEANGTPIVADRYGWALAEAMGASAALSERAVANGDDEAAGVLDEWNRRFEICADLYRGPAGVWYEKRLAPEDGGGVVPPDSPGVEPDYHPLGARYEGYRSARRRLRDD